jgi:hypothetical protein
MKKYFLVLAAVLALALSGCAAKDGQGAAAGGPGVVLTHTEAADVILRDGQKWVRVHGAGVEFQLLGEWEEARDAHGHDANGNPVMSFSLIDDNGVLSSIHIGKSRANEWHARAEYVPSNAHLFSIGVEVCNGLDSSCSQATLLKGGSLLVKCKNPGYYIWLVVIRESKPSNSALAHGIAYFSTGPKENKRAGDFETMMSFLEHR